MSEVLYSIQALLALTVLAVVVERARALLFVAPASRSFADALSQCVANADDRARALAHALPEAWICRIAVAANDSDATERTEHIENVVADLRLEASARLTLLRVSATISSTIGLLAGILAIQRGFSGKGLLSLSAGLAQQVALDEALGHMAVGMGTSAFCFAAFGLLRAAARDVLTQVAHIAARCRGAQAAT